MFKDVISTKTFDGDQMVLNVYKVEDMYQAFKKRLMKELRVSHLAGFDFTLIDKSDETEN